MGNKPFIFQEKRYSQEAGPTDTSPKGWYINTAHTKKKQLRSFNYISFRPTPHQFYVDCWVILCFLCTDAILLCKVCSTSERQTDFCSTWISWTTQTPSPLPLYLCKMEIMFQHTTCMSPKKQQYCMGHRTEVEEYHHRLPELLSWGHVSATSWALSLCVIEVK